MSTTDGVQGIDVSKWQAKTPSLAGRDFLIARASIGTKRDEMYATHIANAKRAGIVTGAYHFNYDGVSVASQVRTFLDAAGDVDLFALDVEGRNAFNKTQAAEFISRVQATGRKCGLYMSESVFFNAGQDWHWVANWDRVPSRKWHIWQYTSNQGTLDENIFGGTLAELHAFAGRDTQSEETATMREYTITPEAVSGTITVVGAGHFFLDMFTDTLDDVADGLSRPAYGPVILTETIDHKGDQANMLRRVGYTFRRTSGTPGFLLATDVEFAPTVGDGPSPEEVQGIVDAAVIEAIATDRAKATIKVVYE